VGGECIRGGAGAEEEAPRVVECGDDGYGDWNGKSSMLTDGGSGDEDSVDIVVSTVQCQCDEPQTTLLLLINRVGVVLHSSQGDKRA
jgi:hypothetical protein